jgi:ABC-type bacteriocin/lantibiotic exporter with double-glycine peptidase domain
LLQAVVTRKATAILNRGMIHSDERTKLESDLVTGIEAVKSQAWEDFFLGRIGKLRSQELAVLWEGFKLSALNTLILQMIPTLVTIATFALYVLLGNTLTATKAFTAVSLFSVLRFPLFQLPMVISFVTKAQVALGRIKVSPLIQQLLCGMFHSDQSSRRILCSEACLRG